MSRTAHLPLSSFSVNDGEGGRGRAPRRIMTTSLRLLIRSVREDRSVPNETYKVGILSPGDMGSAVGRRLHDKGAEVYDVLAGRSELTRTRAAECGFIDAGSLDELVKKVDIILSILVPDQASAIAHDVAEAMKRTGSTPVFAEC